MKQTNKIRLFWLILGALVTLCIGVLTYHPTTVKESVKTVVKTDTITTVIERVDTIIKPKPIYTEILRVDTVKADTVLIYDMRASVIMYQFGRIASTARLGWLLRG